MRVKSALKKIVSATAVLLFWLSVWQGLSLWVGKEILLPSPLLVGKRLLVLGREFSFWLTVVRSLGSVLLGVLFGGIGGVSLAILAFRFPILRRLLSPLLSVMKATPVASFIVLAYVWLSKEDIPLLISVLMVLPILYAGTVAGLENRSAALREVADVFHLSLLRRLKYLTLPSLLPSLRASLLTAVGLAWKAGVAAEAMVRAKETVGNALMDARMTYETVDVFAWTLTVIGISMLMEVFLRRLLSLKSTAEKRRCVA